MLFRSFNVWVRYDFPAAAGRRFAALVESVGGTAINLVVERAMYRNSGGTTWAAGTNALGSEARVFRGGRPGGFYFRAALRAHQEINASRDEPLMCVVVRSDQEPVVVNLDIEACEDPEPIAWVDPHHPESR